MIRFEVHIETRHRFNCVLYSLWLCIHDEKQMYSRLFTNPGEAVDLARAFLQSKLPMGAFR